MPPPLLLLLKARNLWKVVIHTVNLEREEKDARREQKSLEERVRVLKDVNFIIICKYLFCLNKYLETKTKIEFYITLRR